MIQTTTIGVFKTPRDITYHDCITHKQNIGITELDVAVAVDENVVGLEVSVNYA
jgi:hypothetical protein